MDKNTALKVKICGVKNQRAYNACMQNGVDYIGLNFYNASPRYLNPFQISFLGDIRNDGDSRPIRVGLFVNHDIDAIKQILTHVSLDYIQLHGDESPAYVRRVKSEFGLPVIKAIGVRSGEDLHQIDAFDKVSDMVIIDAKPPSGFGGAGVTFDWSVLDKLEIEVPWLLAGGLNANNIDDAYTHFFVRGFKGVPPIGFDVSSGVEDKKGVKSPQKIEEFTKKVKSLNKMA